jgi:hypothetical protein
VKGLIGFLLNKRSIKAQSWSILVRGIMFLCADSTKCYEAIFVLKHNTSVVAPGLGM